jgi:hypothetical protein
LQPKAVTNSSGLNPECSEAMQPLFGIAKANLLLGDVALAAVSSPIVALARNGLPFPMNLSGYAATNLLKCSQHIIWTASGKRRTSKSIKAREQRLGAWARCKD